MLGKIFSNKNNLRTLLLWYILKEIAVFVREFRYRDLV